MESATRLAGDLAVGRTTAVRLARRCLDRIHAVNETWHVFITVMAEQAVADAAASDARRRAGNPLSAIDGLPVAIKDNIDVAGAPTTNGAGAYGDRVATADAGVVQRLRAIASLDASALIAELGAAHAARRRAALRRDAAAGLRHLVT